MKQVPDLIITYLKGLKRYDALISQYESKRTNGYIFEIYFAYAMEQNGIPLEYEKIINPHGQKSVDFYCEHWNNKFCFELLSVDISDPIKTHIEEQEKKAEEDGSFICVHLTTNATNKHFEHGAQIIRLQEKILDKVPKFHKTKNNFYNIIVADCHNVHDGGFNKTDLENLMYGRSSIPELEDRYQDERVKGLLELDFKKRNAKAFRERISAVVCVKQIIPNLLSSKNFEIGYNCWLGENHINKLIDGLRTMKWTAKNNCNN